MSRFKSSLVSGASFCSTGLAITSVIFCVLPYGVLGQTGISLSLKGATIDNNGYVDVDDIGLPTNIAVDGLLCLSTSPTCCRSTASGDLAGHWYFPNDMALGSLTDNMNAGRTVFFGRNRGNNPGVVRLYRSLSGIPPERGRFYCRAPNMADEIQTIYVNILDIGVVTISPTGSTGTAGETYSLTCSATITPNPLPSDVPSPNFEWFFGPTNSSLPSGVTLMAANSGNTYTSTLQFSPLSQSHAGMYTCRLGGNQRLAASATITVNPNTMTTPAEITTQPPINIDVLPITPFGTATAGETYSLVCSVTVTGSTATPTITWLDPMNNQVTSGVMTTGSMSTLTFNPLSASQAGTYICRVALGSAVDTTSRLVTVQNPSITVNITSSVATPMAGSMYTLTCTVTGADRLTDSTITYQWFKNDVEVSGQTMMTLSFSPLTFSGAGSYTCGATVMSSLLSGPITDTSFNSVDVRLTFSSPASVSITSNPPSPVDDMSTVVITCTLVLNSAIVETDLPLLMVDAQLSRDGTPLNLSNPDRSGTTFTYTTQLNSFGRSDSGNYICRATVRPQPSLTYLTGTGSGSGTAEIIIGVYFMLGGRPYRNGGNILITDIGEGDDGALLCVTDLIQCCRGVDAPSGVGALGQWFYPDGSFVQVNGSGDDFYRDRGLNIVRLHRRNNVMSPIGQFCCVVPDTTSVNRNTCINILLDLPTTTAAGPTTMPAVTVPPPVNIQATQSSSSAPVEVSWSPPSNGATNITGYRIYYGDGQSLLAPSYVTSIIFNFVESPSDVGPTVSIRSESMQLSSELISVTVTIADEQMSSEALCTCSSDQVGIAVGALILAEGFIAVVIAIIVTLCWLIVRKRKSGKNDFDVSANMAYGQVKLDTVGERGGEYEDPDKLARSAGRRQGDYETPAPYEFPVSKPEAPVYATADETTTRGKTT